MRYCINFYFIGHQNYEESQLNVHFLLLSSITCSIFILFNLFYWIFINFNLFIYFLFIYNLLWICINFIYLINLLYLLNLSQSFHLFLVEFYLFHSLNAHKELLLVIDLNDVFEKIISLTLMAHHRHRQLYSAYHQNLN